MDSTWETRDLPVLEAIVRLDEKERGAVGLRDVATNAGLSDQDTQQAVRALLGEDPPFFEAGPARAGMVSHVSSVTGHARRTVGAWPTADSLTARLADAFAEAAEHEDEPERKGLLRRGAEFFAGVGRDVTSEVLAKVITQGV